LAGDIYPHLLSFFCFSSLKARIPIHTHLRYLYLIYFLSLLGFPLLTRDRAVETAYSTMRRDRIGKSPGGCWIHKGQDQLSAFMYVIICIYYVNLYLHNTCLVCCQSSAVRSAFFAICSSCLATSSCSLGRACSI